MNQENVFYRDTWVEINLDHVSYNMKGMKRNLYDEVAIMAVVKANAYGHGDVEIAQTALNCGASYLAVAFLDEALSLRKKGIQAPILVLGATRAEDAELAAQNRIALTVFQSEWVEKANGFINSPLNLHVKADTGMGRLGMSDRSDFDQLLAGIRESHLMNIEGVYTHFATADEVDISYFNKQLERFHEILSWFDVLPKFIHSSNSAAALRFEEAQFNMIRTGITMYGLTPSREIEAQLPFSLKPVLSLHSKLSHVKKIKKGEKLSYGATYEAVEDEWIGTLPIGYADGWIRKLQGHEVLIEGVRVPIVGRICMDQCMIRLPYQIPVGTTATLIGEQGQEKITVNDIASKLDTINYEITCMISERVPRMYKQNGEVMRIRNRVL